MFSGIDQDPGGMVKGMREKAKFVPVRGKQEIARANRHLFPLGWFPVLRIGAIVGDIVEVRLAAPVNRTERHVMAAVDRSGSITDFLHRRSMDDQF